MADTKDSKEARAGRKVIQGVVVSDKVPKTRVIDVVRRVPHNFYEKIITTRTYQDRLDTFPLRKTDRFF